jgi:hypothetical protein
MKARTAKQLMVSNLLVKHKAGSHAYGTNIETSDKDFRGIFCADPINVRTPFFRVDEAKDTDEEDTVLYELANFMKLCLDCNPNIIETLWVHEDDIVKSSHGYEALRANRQALLSSKIAFTTSGYALAQLKRIRGHKKWINQPQPEQQPKPCDYLSVVQWLGEEKNLKPALSEYHKDHRLIPFGNDMFGIVHAPNFSLWSSNEGNLNDKFDGDRAEHNNTYLMVVKWNRDEFKIALEKWQQYWTWRKERNKTRSALEEEFGYDCYTEDTEFLTSTGWKKFDNVLDTDTIATFNQFSQKLEYQLPYEKIDSTYTGHLYHLTGYHVDTLVSANHNMYVRPYSRTLKKEDVWQFQRAAELSETFDTLNIIRPKINRQLLPPGINHTLFSHVSMLDYMRLVGWYVSDGTIQFYESGKVKTMMISQSKPQSKLTQTLSKQINSGKIKCNEYVTEPGKLANYPEKRWHFNQELSQIIFEDCGHGSATKRLPKWCFFLTRREMTALLVAAIQGDGTKKDHQNHTYVYYSINKLLADDIQRLAFLCGFETSLCGPFEIKSMFETKNQMYHVHINMRPSTTRRHTRSAAVKKIPVVNQRIVCFMVKNYTLVTRRNGHIGLHGNTKHAMHLVRLLRMGVEALRDGVINVRRPDAAELLEIRNGAWTYEDLVAYAEDMDKQVREVWYFKTDLPKTPDLNFAAELLMDVQDIVWDKW